jgi:hypothetical protein
MRYTTQMPTVTAARGRFNRGILKQACEAAYTKARQELRCFYVGSNYGGYYVCDNEREARGTSNIWYYVDPLGTVCRVEDHPEREILVSFS